MPTSSVELNRLRSLIEAKVQHDYLDRIIQKPAIDEIKLALLYTIMRQTTLPKPKIEQYILSTMFVQMALDTHEIVPLKNDTSESNVLQKKRQLNVLAGDYYSGLYYALLSETNDFTVIHILATAIKDINEHKMSLYYSELHSFDESIHLLTKIESLLISRMSMHVQDLQITELIENIIIINKLLHEKKLLVGNDSSPIFENVKEYATLMSQDDIQNSVDRVIEDKLQSIYQSIANLPYKNEIALIVQEMLKNETTIVKEG